MRLTTISLVGFFAFAVSAAVFAQTPIPWIHNLDQARQLAQQDQRLLLIHFYADWCGPCRTLDRAVFPDPNVGRSISANYIPVKINVDRNQALARKYGINGIPTDVITDAQGRVLSQTKSPSDPAQYIQLLNSLASRQSLTSPVHSVAARMPQQSELLPGAPQNRWDSSWQGQTANPGAMAASLPAQPTGSRYDARAAWQANSYGSEQSGFYSGSRQESAWPQDGSRQTGQFAPADQIARPSNTASSNWNLPNITTESQGNPGTGWPGSAPLQNQGPSDRPGNPQAGWGQSNPLVNGQSVVPNSPPASSWNQPPAADGMSMTASAETTGNGFVNPYVTNSGQAPANSPPGRAPAGVSATNPPLALDGYCAVTLAEGEKWEKGDRMWGARHRGRTYLFISQQQQQKFLADPDRYSPALSGYDPTRFVDYGDPVNGQRRHGMWFRGRTYLFADEDSLRRFSLKPQYYAQKADEIMMAGGR